MNKDSTSRLAIYSALSYFVISSAKLKESLIVNSVWLRGTSIGLCIGLCDHGQRISWKLSII